MRTSFSSTKTLTFSTLGAVFALEEIEFQKFDFILISLLIQDSVHVFKSRIHPLLRKLEFPPGNNVSDKPLTPQDARLSCGQFDVNHMFVR